MQGFILLMMLVYLQIFSLLAVQGLTTLLYQKKLTQHRLEANQQRRQLLSVLAQIDAITTPDCLVATQSASHYATRNLHWWQRHGCKILLDDNQYFYVRELLLTNGCTVINDSSKQLVTPIYYRNTLIYVSTFNAYQSMLVQDTTAVAGVQPSTCRGSPVSIKPGRQMLRFL